MFILIKDIHAGVSFDIYLKKALNNALADSGTSITVACGFHKVSTSICRIFKLMFVP